MELEIVVEMNDKKCTKCKLIKSTTCFTKSNRHKDKLMYNCNDCRKSYRQTLRSKNIIIAREKDKEYYKKNSLHIKNIKKQYRHKNNIKFKEIRLNDVNREKRRVQKNNKKINEPLFKLRDRISTSIYQSLKRNAGGKNKKSFLKFLPYSIKELKQYIESIFEPWMTWKNHGIYSNLNWNDEDSSSWKWQLDHIIPHSHFKYQTMDCEDFKKCWSLSNLRPYSAKQNVLDGANKTRHI